MLFHYITPIKYDGKPPSNDINKVQNKLKHWKRIDMLSFKPLGLKAGDTHTAIKTKTRSVTLPSH